MESGYSLIEKASQACGSRYKLAKALQEDLSFLGKVASGKNPMPPSLAARMAAIAGVDAKRAAMEAVVSQEKNYEKQIALAQALGLPVPPPPISNGVTVQLA